MNADFFRMLGKRRVCGAAAATEPLSAKQRSWRVLRRRILIIAGFVLLAVIVLALQQRVSGKLALRARLAELERCGAEMEMRRLVPKQPASEENALIEIVGLKSGNESADDLRKVAPSLFRYSSPGVKVRALDLREWTYEIFENGESIRRTNDWERFASECAAISNTVAATRLALGRPGFSIGADLERSFMDLPMAEILAIRWPERVLIPTALLALKNRNLPEVDDDVTALIRLVRGAGNDRLLITEMIRRAVFGGLFELIWEALQTGEADERMLERWQHGLEAEDFQLGNLRALQLERAVVLSEFVRLGGEPDYRRRHVEQWAEVYENQLAPGLVPEPTWTLKYVQMPLWLILWQERDCLAAIEHFDQVIDSQSLAIADSWKASRARWGEGSSILEKVFCGMDEPGILDQTRYLFSCRSLMDVEMVAQAARSETRRRMLVVGLALHRFFQKHQKWPESLGNLVPDELAEIPIDPMDGKALRYQREEVGGFRLYSVGENSVDDAGDPSSDEVVGDYSFWDGRDVVWPLAGKILERPIHADVR